MTLATASDRRLHPLSWLFLMLEQLKQFALPLLALLLFGRGGGEWWQWFGAAGALLVALYAVLQYYTYRFRIADAELTIRSGLLHRNVRHIPLARIQNVVQRRNLLHRLAGVAEVRLESAAGQAQAEADMKVLSLADAEALEALVRASRAAARDDAADGGGMPAAPEPEPLLRLPIAELVRLGISSNRGMVVVAAGFGAAWQLGDGVGKRLGDIGEQAFGFARDLHPGPLQWLLGLVVLVLLAAVALRLLSVLLAILRLYDFRLTEADQRLSVEGGLLTRLRGHAARSKIQRWRIDANVWQRLMDRQRLAVDTAAVRRLNDEQGLSDLVPIAPPQVIDTLLGRWLPALDWPDLPWQPLHPRAWRRFLFFPAMLTLAASIGLALQFGATGLLPLLLLPLWAWRARQIANCSGWFDDGRHVGWRSGWLDRHWQLVEIRHLQLLRIEQSPFDRRHGMASLLLDTAGADPTDEALRLRFLPEAEVRALAARLARQVAQG